jgi:hypothetical protein
MKATVRMALAAIPTAVRPADAGHDVVHSAFAQPVPLICHRRGGIAAASAQA